jgi:hypothetical protein
VISAFSAALLVTVAVFVLIAVAVGTVCARLFLAASRGRPIRGGSDEEI